MVQTTRPGSHSCTQLRSTTGIRRSNRFVATVRAANVVIVAVLISALGTASAETLDSGMGMSTKVLLVAQLDAKQVSPPNSSKATGTGAFVLDSAAHRLEYNLTYEGMETGVPETIALYNFGPGKDGKVVVTLCGPQASHCPQQTSATVSGDVANASALSNHFIGEFDAGRVYVEIETRARGAEIRGQLGLNSAMVKVVNYASHLAPIAGIHSQGTGTAILSETYLPGGKVAVFYALTVASTSSVPTRAVLTGGSAPKARSLSATLRLPATGQYSRDRRGGSLSGSYNIAATESGAAALRLLSAEGPAIRLVVFTSRFPNGELYGDLRPIR